MRATQNKSAVAREVLAGTTVALTLTVESMAFAVVCGLPATQGIWTSCAFGLLSSVAGRGSFIGGAAGALAVLTGVLVREHGAEYLFAASALCGVFELVVWRASLASIAQAVPDAVVDGFATGLSLLIARSQLELFHEAETWSDLTSTVALVLAGLLVAHMAPQFVQGVPPALLTVLVITAFVHATGLDAPTVSVGDATGPGPSMDALLGTFVRVPRVPWTLETLYTITPIAMQMAAVGLTETVLTWRIAQDRAGTPPPPVASDTSAGSGSAKWATSLHDEFRGQGVANLLAGLFLGSMGGCAMIVPTQLNIQSGGRTKLSGVACAAFMFLILVLGAEYMAAIPKASLSSVLLSVCLHAFPFRMWMRVRHLPLADTLSMAAVAVVTLAWNLAAGAAAGLFISAFASSLRVARSLSVTRTSNKLKHTTLWPEGYLFWASVPTLEREAMACLRSMRAEKRDSRLRPDSAPPRASRDEVIPADNGTATEDSDLTLILNLESCQVIDQTAASFIAKMQRLCRGAQLKFVVHGADQESLQLLLKSGIPCEV